MLAFAMSLRYFAKNKTELRLKRYPNPQIVKDLCSFLFRHVVALAFNIPKQNMTWAPPGRWSSRDGVASWSRLESNWIGTAKQNVLQRCSVPSGKLT